MTKPSPITREPSASGSSKTRRSSLADAGCSSLPPASGSASALNAGACLLLARAKNAAESAAVGNQCGGRVFLFLHTDDFHRDHAVFKTRGVEFLETPRAESYCTVAVFRDLYGNKWDLLQLHAPAAPI